MLPRVAISRTAGAHHCTLARGYTQGMNGIAQAATAGAVGAATTAALHEVTRHMIKDAPRVDLLGMQGIARGARMAGAELRGQALFATTMAADLVSNSLYYAVIGLASRETAVPIGIALGAAAGLGAVVLPGPLGFSASTTNKTMRTKVLVTALYTLGGVAAGLTYRRLKST